MKNLAILFHLSIFIPITALGQKETPKTYPFSLIYEKGKCYSIEINEGHKLQKNDYVDDLPKLESIYGAIKREDVETKRFAEKYRKYAPIMDRAFEQMKKQRNINDEQSPLYQIYKRWLTDSYGNKSYSKVYKDKKMKLATAGLCDRLYRFPRIGTLDPNHKQPKGDSIKPKLFSIDGKYYSVFGDTRIAHHVSVDAKSRGPYASIRYPGNILFAFSKEIPPALQTCGIDANGVIWLCDQDGHIAFFQTKTNEFLQKIVTVKKRKKLLVPRRNLSSSIFAFEKGNSNYAEYNISNIGKQEKISANLRRLPNGTTHILFCSHEKIVYLLHKKIIMQEKSGKTTQKELAIDGRESIIEGVYNPETSECLLLICKKTSLDSVYEVRNSWKDMRVIETNLSE